MDRSNKEILQQRITKIKTGENGEEIESIEESVYILPSEPPFVKLYLADIAKVQELPPTATNLMYELLNLMNYKTNEIILNSTIKRRIAGILGINEGTVANKLHELTKKQVLISTERGIYVVNPNLFGKGSWKDIYRLRKQLGGSLSFTINYDLETGERTLSSNIEEQVNRLPGDSKTDSNLLK